MIKTLLLIPFIALSLFASAQSVPRLSIKVRGDEVSMGQLPLDTIDHIKLTSRQLRKGKIKMSYRNESNDADVKRTIMIEDTSGKQVYSAEASSFKLRSAELRAMLRLSPLRVFTMAIPSDPEKAKVVRVRRFEIAELKLVSNE